MNITRYNYETYFFLYADNELSEQEKKLVEAFAEQHPDLKAELESLLQTIVPADEAVEFRDKEMLFRTTEPGLINITNYEAYFVAYGDDELNNTEKAATEKFVYDNPEFQVDFELIQQARLTSDRNIVFPNKKLLYKTESRKPVPAIPIWTRYAAACVLVIAGVIWLMQPGTSPGTSPATDKSLAVTNEKKSISTHPKNNEERNAPNGKEEPQTTTAGNKNGSNTTIREENNIHKETVNVNIAKNTKREGQDNSTIEPSIVKQVKTTTVQTDESVDAREIVPDHPKVPAEATVIPTDKPGDKMESKTGASYAVNTVPDDYIYVPAESKVKKTPFRGFLRKASRFIEQNPVTNDRQKGVYTASAEEQ